MVCPQDERLKSMNMYVDYFGFKGEGFVFLTHAHEDHTVGLGIKRTKELCGRIFCTEETKQLILLRYPKYSSSAFVPLPVGHVSEVNGVLVTPLPAHHCHGSVMYHFEWPDNGETVLYTSDYRLDNSIKEYGLFKNSITRLYYDDLLDVLTKNKYPEYPTLETTVKKMHYSICRVRTGDPIFINSSILGIELVLEKLSERHGYKYSISEHLSNTYRAKQLKYLLPGRIVEDSDLVLGHRRLDSTVNVSWIVPTCTRFLCGNRPERENNVTYVWFSGHANKDENDRLKRIVCAKQVNPCQDRMETLKCQKE